ncbi:MAG: HAD family hydrolase [Litorilinea sp.]
MLRTGDGRPQAVFFDLYETLITEFDPNFTPRPTLAEWLQVDHQRFVAEWRKFQKRKMEGKIPNFPAVLKEICQRLEVIPPPEHVLQRLLEERVEAKAIPFQQIEEGILQMLMRLRNAGGIKLGLISNASDEEVGGWKSSRLSSFFDDVIFSYEVGIAKPDKQIYGLACERLGVSAGASLFVGDGTSDELVGAKNAGMKPMWAVWFLNRWPEWKMPLDIRQRNAQFTELKSLVDLISIIDSEG